MKKIWLLLLPLVTTVAFGCNKSTNKELVILYTNDVHGHFGEEEKLSYSYVAQMKKDLKSEGHDVVLVDAGDHLSGSLNAVYDRGETVKKLMNAADYDVATFGNHEFDNNFNRLYDVIATAKYDYLCCNLYHADESGKPTTHFAQPSKIFEFKDYKLGIIGISTPESVGDSTPEFFEGYCFSNNEKLYEDVQSEVDYLKQEGCNVVIALAHLGMEEENDTSPFSSKAIVEHTKDIDALIDGHSHFLMPKKLVKNKDNKDVIITQTGSYFDRVGQMTITPKNDGYEIDTKMVEEYPNADAKIKKIEKDFVDNIEKEYGKRIAETEVKLQQSSVGEDTNLAEICADSFYYYANNSEECKSIDGGIDLAFVNRGGIRVSVDPGDITIKKCRQIFAFDNSFVVAEVKGKTLWQALEYSMRGYPEYAGGALIPAGLKCDVDCSKHVDFKLDDSGRWVSGPNDLSEEHRISNIKIFNRTQNTWKDFDMDAIYKVAGSNYILESGGDGLNMLGPDNPEHNVLLHSNTTYDYMCLVDYISNFTKKGEYPNISTSNSPLKAYTNYLLDCEKGGTRYNFSNVPQ